ncbi:MAG: DUF4974 domain-containing protein [Niabella sp.]|nr:DUF4974 domain-containing protein [Niabella sp.]
MDRELFLTLLTKKISNELSDTEVALLEETLRQNSEYAAIAHAIMTYGSLPEGSYEEHVAEQLENVWVRLRYPVEEASARKRTGYQFWLKIAAVLVVLAGLCFWVFNSAHRSATAPITGMDTLRSGEQELYTVLNDGTQVTLNKESSIIYNTGFGKQQRQVILNGAAFFDVAKNEKIPLVVQAGTIDIEVKGTAFNVNAYQNKRDIEVVLVRGLVQVTNKYNRKNQVLLSPNQQLRASSEKQTDLLFNITNLPQDTIAPIKQLPDTISFKKEKLENLARLLEKKYAVTILIQNEALKEKRYSGLFAKETLQEALEALTQSYPFNYKIEENQVVIN